VLTFPVFWSSAQITSLIAILDGGVIENVELVGLPLILVADVVKITGKLVS
jgi:hypothetical protein